MAENLNIIQKNFENFEQCEGELVYLSRSTGPFVIHNVTFFPERTDSKAIFFIDPAIYVKKLRNCVVANKNLIIINNGSLLANNGYHFITPNVDIRHYGVKPDNVLRAPNYDYLVTEIRASRKTGFI